MVSFITLKLCWLVGLLVCDQGNTKTTERISAKLGWRIGLGPE